jgi:hypothetical protein
MSSVLSFLGEAGTIRAIESRAETRDTRPSMSSCMQ